MKEISRRASSTVSSGLACGPFSVYAVDAEIVVEDEGNTVYLHSQVVSEYFYGVSFEANTQSIYDLEKKIDMSSKKFFEQVEERDRISYETDVERVLGYTNIRERYAEQYEQLVDMMQEVARRDGYDVNLRVPDYECYNDVWPELEETFKRVMAGRTDPAYAPVKVMDEEENDGVRYQILCEVNGSCKDLAVVTIYQDLEGKASLLAIEDFVPKE